MSDPTNAETRDAMSDPQSIEDVLEGAWPDSAYEADALAAAVDEHGTIPDRERGIAVIRLDPELAGDLRWGADHLAPSEITMTPPPRGSLRWAAAVMDAAARIIGGEQSDGD